MESEPIRPILEIFGFMFRILRYLFDGLTGPVVLD